MQKVHMPVPTYYCPTITVTVSYIVKCNQSFRSTPTVYKQFHYNPTMTLSYLIYRLNNTQTCIP